MCENNKKKDLTAIVNYNRSIGSCFYHLGLQLDASEASDFGKAYPGQFVQLYLTDCKTKKPDDCSNQLSDKAGRSILLRRPFSFCNVTVKNNKINIDILYCVKGPGTIKMATLVKGDAINILGPLGNGFSIPEHKTTALLIAGGTGAGPMLHIASELTIKSSTIKPIAFVGAKTKHDLPFEKRANELADNIDFPLLEFGRFGIESHISTDDGSAGVKGLVTDLMDNWLKTNKISPDETIIYSCGPEPMLAAVAKIAKNSKIDCQVNMERMMACGIGLCQSCAVECHDKQNDGQTIYKTCCKDGPVFDAKEIVF